MKTINSFSTKDLIPKAIPNHWDLMAIILIASLFSLIIWGGKEMIGPYSIDTLPAISLNISQLPYYAFRSVLRLFIALIFVFITTFTLGTLAAKNKRAGRIIIPLIDVLQSLPVLGILPMGAVVFIALFPHRLLGPECASILAVFFSQAWNIILSFYQSLRTLPKSIIDVSHVMQLSAWQHFWRVEVPFSMPGLLVNTMLSMSAAWFFVVASEVIYVGKHVIFLPGIGSYVSVALSQQNGKAICFAVGMMFFVILCYDQLLFRPLNQWITQFSPHQESEQYTKSWVVTLFSKTHFVKLICQYLPLLIPQRSYKKSTLAKKPRPAHKRIGKTISTFISTLLILSVLLLGYHYIPLLVSHYSLREVGYVSWLCSITGLRILILITLSVIVWLPVGVWIGRHQKVCDIIQPLIQFAAAFPANLLYPILVPIIITFHLNINIWAAPLIVLGTQWYILFNVIAGARALPQSLYHVGLSLQLGWLVKWRKLVLPAVFPYLITGTITAAGGAWNACIVAESLTWGDNNLYAKGIGAYITQASTTQNFPNLILGVMVMAVFVVAINRFFWQPLYDYAEKRFRLDSL